MQLYKMELNKIVRNKLTYVASGILFLIILISFIHEFSLSKEMVMEFSKRTCFRRLLDLSEFYFLYISIWLITVFSAFYCEDKQNKVDVLLSTTTRGKLYVFFIRLLVILTLTLCSFLFIIITTFLFCYFVYGYMDSRVLVEDVVYTKIMDPFLAKRTIDSFIKYYFIIAFSALIMLDALIVWVSVNVKKSLYSFVILLVIYFLPIYLESIIKCSNLNVGYALITNQPILLITVRCFTKSWPIYSIHLLIAYLIFGIAIWSSAKRWNSIAER